MIEEFFASAPFALSQSEKEPRLLAGLSELVAHHRAHCPPYRRVLERLGVPADARFGSLADLPYLPVGLFKLHDLKSIADADVSVLMTSSGTMGAASRIHVDAATAALQSRALAHVIGSITGGKRLPMLVVDSRSVVASDSTLTARGAGVLGMMRFGARHTFVLDDAGQPDESAVLAFLDRYGGAPFLIFGFTFMVWLYLYAMTERRKLDLANGILIHSGGWKKLEAEAVTAAAFRQRFAASSGLRRIHNFYGMVEQIGTVFLEADDNLLYPPSFADVIIRDPRTLAPLPPGETGLIEVFSLLPRSYPGHVILTEDLGAVRRIDNPAAQRGGKGIVVTGRLPRAQLRGCSDTFVAAAQ